MRMVSNATDARLQSPTEVALSGDLAFVALEMSTLAVVNISDPANPQVEGVPRISESTCLGYFMLLQEGSDKSWAIQASGKVVDAFNKYPYAYGIAASGEFAYVLSYDSATLIIINASDPTEPFICGTVTDKERAWHHTWPILFLQVSPFLFASHYAQVAAACHFPGFLLSVLVQGLF